LADKKDARVSFIHRELSEINEELKAKNTRLHTFYSTPEEAFKQITEEYDIQEVHTNRDYEPYATERDSKIENILGNQTAFITHKDQVIFEPNEVLKDNGTPYLVYTPFSRKWLAEITDENYASVSSGLLFDNWFQTNSKLIISLKRVYCCP
jgi:deoxyribodipyrimidine photo-lyase